jgi:tripartite-type tricarboxylate transporter receptor subunit TctC
MTSRRFCCALALAAAGVSSALGQNYPARPITLVVPFAAGGPVDAVARILSVPMGKALGQTVLVDYTVGAAGTLGVGRVARRLYAEHRPLGYARHQCGDLSAAIRRAQGPRARGHDLRESPDGRGERLVPCN